MQALFASELFQSIRGGEEKHRVFSFNNDEAHEMIGISSSTTAIIINCLVTNCNQGRIYVLTGAAKVCGQVNGHPY